MKSALRTQGGFQIIDGNKFRWYDLPASPVAIVNRTSYVPNTLTFSGREHVRFELEALISVALE